MFEKININENVLRFFKNELALNREAGTYIFYGNDRDNLKRMAKIFAKALNCLKLKDDFCDECESCLRIERETHGDLEILDDISGIKIEKIRELIEKDSVGSYEGNKKVYIIRDIEKLRKESANALLKLIEEPNRGSFFILLSTGLNILATIKSRGILLAVPNVTAEELEVREEEYRFFFGKSGEIRKYKKLDNYDLNSPFSFENIGENIRLFLETRDFKYKIDVYKSLRDFVKSRKYLNLLDKLFFIDEIFFNCTERELIREIMGYTLSCLELKNEKLEKLLEIKNMGRANVSIKVLLVTFFVKL